MKIVAIVQARMGSTRLPGKVMQLVNNEPLIDILLSRINMSNRINNVVVATSLSTADDVLCDHLQFIGADFFRGSEHDVLDRFYHAALSEKADVVVRITGDCPLADAALIDEMITAYFEYDVDYYSNVNPPTYPDGLDVEVFSFAALEKAFYESHEKFDREHVTPFLRESGIFSTGNHYSDTDFSKLRLTVDVPDDLDVIRAIFSSLHTDIYFSWQEVIDLYKRNPKIFSFNNGFVRNEGADMGTGQKLWLRAKNVIPGGNMLLSKRPEMFLPQKWPAYFSKAKGCYVWDLDGNQLTDVSIMGVGTNILGYGNASVDSAVMASIASGNMSTLNAPEEVYLAEKLVELHPWADMVRFARSGGEANAIAIRIARAATGKDQVAICGYHGWHDWYLSANLNDDENLSSHLLPGLEPNGVPRGLKGTTHPFNYNRIDELEQIVRDHDIGAIKMEVSRNHGPENDFLQKVRDLATQNGIVLIFDECTSGFRETFGGLHKKYGVDPDMAMFGKALGNGYAVTATIGRREIMEAAQTSFISSTFWTERVGSVAGLATLKEMESLNSWDKITSTGHWIRGQWCDLARKHKLDIDLWGLPALTGFSFKVENNLAYKTLISQEMLKKHFLASNSIYVSIAHTPEILSDYLDGLDDVFSQIARCEAGQISIAEILEGPVCHAGFKRLN